MINFCLMIILLSALRKILFQIDRNTVTAVDDKLETIIFTIVGALMFLYEVIKPSKTELALYQKQKELAFDNAHNICNKIKTLLVSAYNKYFITSKPMQQKNKKANLHLLQMSIKSELTEQNNSKVA